MQRKSSRRGVPATNPHVIGPAIPLLSVDAHPLSPPLVRSNYGITTTSKTEWAFVVDDDGATPEGLSRWPEESESLLPDRKKCRVKTPLTKLIQRAAKYSEQLEKAKQPPLVKEEIIAASLYTGPVCPSY